MKANSLDSAIEDMTRAIQIMSVVRTKLVKNGQWHARFQMSLARAYSNRGGSNYNSSNYVSAIDDYAKAIEIAIELRGTLSSLGFWHRGIRDDFITMLRNRALTYGQSGQPDLAAADRKTIAEVEAIKGP